MQSAAAQETFPLSWMYHMSGLECRDILIHQYRISAPYILLAIEGIIKTEYAMLYRYWQDRATTKAKPLSDHSGWVPAFHPSTHSNCNYLGL